ncbi:hypothetical protein CR970_04275 [Candidatus Saccharibacteria bacterium]|nr:MAG: hypothetical protein CR970_04275 [Candidatus Saccharibacteria bacterium]
MKKSAKTLLKRKQLLGDNSRIFIGVLVVFAGLATLMLFMARAATDSVTLEAESSTPSGSASIVDSSDASGGKALRFGGSQTPPPQCDNSSPGPLRIDSSFMGATTGVEVKYSVQLPEGYYDDCKQYPVMYTLHGKESSNELFLEVALSIRPAIDEGILPEMIIVTPDSYYDGRWQNTGKGPAEDNFIKELIPFMEQNYRVKPGAGSRLLTGFSMGGHGAFYHAAKHPQMFAATLSVDAAMSYNLSEYSGFIDQVKQHNTPIYGMGGQLCGARTQAVFDSFNSQGADLPYVYYDLPHDYNAFLQRDRQEGWPGVRYLADHLE